VPNIYRVELEATLLPDKYTLLRLRSSDADWSHVKPILAALGADLEQLKYTGQAAKMAETEDELEQAWLRNEEATQGLQSAIDALSDGFDMLIASVEKLDAATTLPANEALQSLLTERELEVAELVMQRFSNKEIADRLLIAAVTVKSHKENIGTKLGIGAISDSREIRQAIEGFRRKGQ
jgi:ATP/maltotriose-dependent transcriptional regulator MalT